MEGIGIEIVETLYYVKSGEGSVSAREVLKIKL